MKKVQFSTLVVESKLQGTNKPNAKDKRLGVVRWDNLHIGQSETSF